MEGLIPINIRESMKERNGQKGKGKEWTRRRGWKGSDGGHAGADTAPAQC